MRNCILYSQLFWFLWWSWSWQCLLWAAFLHSNNAISLANCKMLRPIFLDSVGLWLPPKYQVQFIQLTHHTKYQKRQWVLHVYSTSHSTVIFRVVLIWQNQDSTYLFRSNNLAQDLFKVLTKNDFIKSTDFLQVSSFVMEEFRLFPLCFMGNDWLTDFMSYNKCDISSFF